TTLERLAEPRPKAVKVGDRAQQEDGRPLAIAGAHEIADVDERLVPGEAHTAVVVDGDAHQLYRIAFSLAASSGSSVKPSATICSSSSPVTGSSVSLVFAASARE